MRINLGIFLLALTLAVLAATGCETGDDRTIASAQACLDSARSSTDADRCLSILGSLDTAQANLLKCSASYVRQNFTSTRFADAFQRLKNTPSGTGGQSTDAMGTTMSFLAFSSTSDANTALTYCRRSGSRSMERLASMTVIATTTISLAAGLPGCPTLSAVTSGSGVDISSCITGLQGSSTDKTALGNAATAAQQAYCNEGSSFQNNEVCRNLNTAISNGNGDPTAIANQLLALLQN